MPSTESPRRHGRNISHPILRRNTKGPLDEDAESVDDPLSNPPHIENETASTVSSQPVDSSPKANTVQSVSRLSNETTASHPGPTPSINLQFLHEYGLYHKLTTEDISPVFFNSPNTPPPEASLANLLSTGHFRRAAEVSARTLLRAPSTTGARDLLAIFYTRLACLVLISRPDIALQEAMPLLDLLAAPPSEEHRALLNETPWELRLLLARLQTLGAPDGGRRGIMALYALAAEARGLLRAARKSEGTDGEATIALWSTRLEDLGIRVGDALVEMGELETASRHFDGLTESRSIEDLAYRKALLRVRVGDIAGAQRCVSVLPENGTQRKGLEALVAVADGDYAAAIETWDTLIEDFPNHELFAQNAAISMLYTGRIRSTREALESIAGRLPMFPALLFNLSTVYELCSERAVDRKMNLVQQAAAKTPGPESGGWERANFEFKL